MDNYLHRVVGLYPTRELAASARDAILAHGFAPQQVRLLPGGAADAGNDAVSDSDDVLNDLLRDGAIGTVVGTAAGAGVTIALAAANITLFIGSPVLGALYLLGWGASLGGLAGAMVGAERIKGGVPGLIKDALANGHIVLVVHAPTERQTSQVREIMGKSIAVAGNSPPIEAPTIAPVAR